MLFKSDESTKTIDFYIWIQKLKVEEANEKDKLSIKQIVAKFNVSKTQVYEILKKKSELKERKIIWEKCTLIV